MTENPMGTQMPESGNNMNLVAIVGVILVVGLVVYVMMRSNTPSSPAEQTNIEVMEETVVELENVVEDNEEAMEEEIMIKEFEVEAGSFYFQPDTMTVKLGDTVRITLNAVDMTHDFVIDELGVQSQVVAEGDSTTIEFIADQVGEFEYYCSVDQHRQQGMVGTLVIEE